MTSGACFDLVLSIHPVLLVIVSRVVRFHACLGTCQHLTSPLSQMKMRRSHVTILASTTWHSHTSRSLTGNPKSGLECIKSQKHLVHTESQPLLYTNGHVTGARTRYIGHLDPSWQANPHGWDSGFERSERPAGWSPIQRTHTNHIATHIEALSGGIATNGTKSA